MPREINDGIQRVNELSPLLSDLLDTPEVHRTERITQNGLCSVVFPSIKHDRKVHLIGTSRCAKSVSDALKRNGTPLSDNEINTLQAIALLHDIGHPPFAHALRHIMEKQSGMTHEEISAHLILGDIKLVDYFMQYPHLLGNSALVSSALARYTSLKSIPDILSSHGVDKTLVASALAPRVTNVLVPDDRFFLKELIDGVIFDIDKMDYLVRDSTGANIDEGRVSPHRLLHTIRIVPFRGKNRIAFSEASLDDLGSWVDARKYMYANVYTQKTILMYEALLSEAVRHSLPYFERENIELHFLDDRTLEYHLMQYDPISVDLTLAVLYGRQFTYRESFSLSPERVGDNKNNPSFSPLSAIQKFLHAHNNLPFPSDALRDEIISRCATSSGSRLGTHEVLVYSPYDFKTPEDWKKKLDVVIYSKQDHSIACTLLDLVEGTAPFHNYNAQSVFNSFCKPQTSRYFAVYCPREHVDSVRRATTDLLTELQK